MVVKMKVICLGGGLGGFPPEDIIAIASQLKQKVAGDEKVVIVTHNVPYEQDPAFPDDPGKTVLAPDLFKHNLQAVLLTHRAEKAVPVEINRLRGDLAEKCNRVFGLGRGWNQVKDEIREKILTFLKSDAGIPVDTDVQALLGFDAPVARLALRATLEIAVRKIKTSEPEIDIKQILEPAFKVVEQEPSLAHLIGGIKKARDGNSDQLYEEIVKALAPLRGEALKETNHGL
ncbi:MAG: hypothetical protein QOJ02_1840 [Acidobacteriota bacterium]|jgi:hypothetical protein|nr:hypothetical protein [Acidobacteriota bacterium]